MPKTVFISYSHKQGEWVWKNLVPCLRAGGAEVRIDVERMRAGGNVTVQMDVEQDASDFSVLVLSQDYFNSGYCQHEMQRAFARDKFVGVVRADCAMPDEIRNTKYVDLRDDKAADKWDLLMAVCDAELGTAAPDWLHARDEIVDSLKKGESVVYKIKGKLKWRELLNDVQKYLPDLKEVDLDSGATCSRKSLVEEILWTNDPNVMVPDEPHDLKVLQRTIMEGGHKQIAFLHFHSINDKDYHNKPDFFKALKHLLSQKPTKFTVLILTRIDFSALLPKGFLDHSSPFAIKNLN